MNDFDEVFIANHCNATHPCDEHHSEHRRYQRTVKWVIDLAKFTVYARVITAKSFHDWKRVYVNARTLHELLNDQWRDIHREQGIYERRDECAPDGFIPEYVAEGQTLAQVLGIRPKLTVDRRF